MIQSRQDYLYYLNADRIALGGQPVNFKNQFREFISPQPIHKFQRLLRKCEYFSNCRKDFFSKVYYLYIKYRLIKLSIKLGFSIPENVFGPGLAIIHYGTIVVNARAKVGANCRIHPSTCIGTSGGTSKAPTIGDNVYIAPGVKIYGDIILANNIVTAANAAVGSSFLEENILIGGVPARKIKDIDISAIIKHLKH